jgi:hypothetical protein
VPWQDHSERGARADFAFELDPPLEQLNKAAHDCETESGTGLARTSFGKTLKVLENLFPALQRNPWARVIDFQHPALSAVPGEAQTYAAKPRIFHGVGTEVQGDLAQLQAIAYDLHQSLFHRPGEAQSFVVGHFPKDKGNVAVQIDETQTFGVQFVLTEKEIREVDETLNESVDVADVRRKHGQVLAIPVQI